MIVKNQLPLGGSFSLYKTGCSPLAIGIQDNCPVLWWVMDDKYCNDYLFEVVTTGSNEPEGMSYLGTFNMAASVSDLPYYVGHVYWKEIEGDHDHLD